MAGTLRRDVDGGWAWWVLLASYVNLLLCSGLAFVAGMFQVVFLEEYEGSVALTSWVTSLFSSLMQLGGPLSSLISNSTNCRVAVMVGGACLSTGLALSSMADSLGLLFVSFGVIGGVGLGLTYTSSVVVINYFFDQRRTMVTGVALSASGLGIVLAPQASQYLFDNLSWREALITLGAAAAQICIFGALMYPVHEMWNSRCSRLRSKVLAECCCPAWCQESRNMTGNDNRSVAYGFKPPIDMEVVAENVMVLDSVYRDSRGVTNEHSSHLSVGDNVQDFENSLRLDVIKAAVKEMTHSDMQQSLPTHSSGYVSPHWPSHMDEHQPLASNPDISHCMFVSRVNDNNFKLKHDRGKGQEHVTVENRSLLSLNENSRHILLNSGYRHTSQTQSHFELHRHPHLHRTKTNVSNQELHRGLSCHGSGFLNKQQILQLKRPLPSGEKLLTSRTDTEHGSHGSYSSLPFSMKSKFHDSSSLLKHVIVVSHNQSLTSLVPSIHHIEVIIPDVQRCTGVPVKANSYTSLSSEAKSLGKETSKKAASLKSSVLSVASIPLHYHQDTYQRQKYLACNIKFLILCLQLFLANCGCGIINIHMPSFTKEQGLTDQEMTNILSVNGFACLFGRIMVGFLANATESIELLLYWALHILGGIFAIMMPDIGTTFWQLAVITFFMGTFYGSVYSVLTSITIRYVGLHNLATAFGVEMVCAGLGYLVAPPCAGVLVDITGSYNYDMYCGGSLYILSSLVLLLIPLLASEMEIPAAEVEHSHVEDGTLDDDDNNDIAIVGGGDAEGEDDTTEKGKQF